jgi:cytochrome c oxidase cbb3-type subunit IV
MQPFISNFITTFWTPIFVVIFLVIVLYALRPSNSKAFGDAGKMPLRED